MKIQNSTNWSEPFLRKMVAWCARQVGAKIKWIPPIKFHNAERGWSGRGGPTRVRVGISPNEKFSYTNTTGYRYGGVVIPDLADRIETLIAVTAHELRHVQQYAKKRILTLRKYKTVESDAMQAEIAALKEFRANRETLLAEWGAAPAETPKAKPTAAGVIERRAAKAADDLKRWQKKLKTAANKVKKYRARVRYYERKIFVYQYDRVSVWRCRNPRFGGSH